MHDLIGRKSWWSAPAAAGLSIRALSDDLGISQNHLGNQFKAMGNVISYMGHVA